MTANRTPDRPEEMERSDSRRNRRRLVEAARATIAERGLDVSALDIATQAEVGVGTLYRRFGTKEALIEAVLADLVDELIDAGEAAINAEDSWNGFGAFLIAFGESQLSSRGLAEQLTGTEPAKAGSAGQVMNPLQTPLFRARYARLRQLTRTIVERAHEDGHLRLDVSWRDVVLLSRAQVSATSCLGVQAGDGQWARTAAILLDGLRAGGSKLPGQAARDDDREQDADSPAM